MTYTGWAITLNGVTVVQNCDEHTTDVNCPTPVLTIEGLDRPPDGLGLPGLRTEDVTYFQRDGVRHFNDWYLPRIITALVTVGPDEPECTKCTTTRQQLAELVKAWRRSCCDIELVVHTPCDGDSVEGTPVLGPAVRRRNLIRNPSFETGTTFWTVPADSFCRNYPRCYTGGGWCYSNATDGTFTETHGTDGGYVGDGYFRLTADVAPTMPGSGFTYAPSLDVNEIDVSATVQYTSSAYLRASDAKTLVAQILWYDSIGTLLGVATGSTVEVGTDWTRVDVTGTAPEDADHAHAQWVTTEAADWSNGDTLDIDAALFETGSELLTYFDGSTPDVHDEPVVGGVVETNIWTGTENLSVSLQSSQTYVENVDRSLFGPVGIVGRPRGAPYQWLNRDDNIATVTLRFDAADHRMYVLDECGTPGYQDCVDVYPGLIQSCRTYPLCYTEGRCYTNDGGATLVVPVTATLGGTERVNPLIVLYPGLSYPTVENMNNSEFIEFNGVVESEPVQIDTENGIATGVSSGASYTHLLGGSIFMSMDPGQNTFRMYSRASSDTGYAAVCFRSVVVSI